MFLLPTSDREIMSASSPDTSLPELTIDGNKENNPDSQQHSGITSSNRAVSWLKLLGFSELNVFSQKLSGIRTYFELAHNGNWKFSTIYRNTFK